MQTFTAALFTSLAALATAQNTFTEYTVFELVADQGHASLPAEITGSPVVYEGLTGQVGWFNTSTTLQLALTFRDYDLAGPAYIDNDPTNQTQLILNPTGDATNYTAVVGVPASLPSSSSSLHRDFSQSLLAGANGVNHYFGYGERPNDAWLACKSKDGYSLFYDGVGTTHDALNSTCTGGFTMLMLPA